MSKKDIYAASYNGEPDIEALEGTLEERMRKARKLGVMLRESRSSEKHLKSALKILEKKHKTLNEQTRAMQVLLTEEQENNQRLRRENEALRIENRRLGIRV